MFPTEEIPVTAIPNNVYMLIYLLFALAIGPAGLSLIKAIRDYGKDKTAGHRDRITEMEDWTHDVTYERNFYAARDRWRGELIGKLEYKMMTHPECGPDYVREIRATMPPEPSWEDRHNIPREWDTRDSKR